MLSFDTIHTLTDALLDAERDAEHAGWTTPPTLLCLHVDTRADTRADTTAGTAGGLAGPIAASRDRKVFGTAVPLPAPPDLDHGHHGLPGVLADLITAHRDNAAAWARTRHAGPDTRVLAWALLFEHRTGADAHGRSRAVHAADIDGRRYMLTRRHGEHHPIVEVTDDPGPQPPATHRPLTALVEATTGMTNGTTDSTTPDLTLAPPALPAPPDAAARATVTEADPGAESPAALERLLMESWTRFHHGRPPDGWLGATTAAITEHLRRRPAQAHAALDRLRARIRAQITSAIADDHLDMDLGAGILEACGLEPPLRHYTVGLRVPFQVEVSATNDEDAFDAAADHLETTLRLGERTEADWTDCEPGHAQPGEIDLDEA